MWWLLACAAPPEVDGRRLDQVGWYETLRERRPDLLVVDGRGVRDPGWQALVVRPEYRVALLAEPGATVETLVASEYSREERAADRAWAERMRQRATPAGRIRPGGYPPEIYASYRIGDGPLVDLDRRGYKVLFELDHAWERLTPDRLWSFAAALDRAGFDGDVKVDLRLPSARFYFNHVIVHAGSMEMAVRAERVGLDFFGADVLHYTRGVDGYAPEGGLDWHHLLLTGGFDALPSEVRAFVGGGGAAP